jgi:hypothetical protein
MDSPSPTACHWIYDDGGRQAAGFKGKASDCFTRAVAIASRIPYSEIYAYVNAVARELKQKELTKEVKQAKKPFRGSLGDARRGVRNPLFHEVMRRLGWKWFPTMYYGKGCKVHLCREELPAGRLVCRVTKHMVAVVDGVIHDTYDPSRGSTRCVYGYFSKSEDVVPLLHLAPSISEPAVLAKSAVKGVQVETTTKAQKRKGPKVLGKENLMPTCGSDCKLEASVSAFSDDDSDEDMRLRVNRKKIKALNKTASRQGAH